MIDGGRRGRSDPIGAKAVKQGVDVAWLGEREGALGAVVSNRKAQEFGRDGMGFQKVETGKAKDEIVVVVAILVLDAKSSTTRTNEMGRDTWRNRQGVEVSRKSDSGKRETRRRFESLPVSFKPYMV
jgi:hypothetical protein